MKVPRSSRSILVTALGVSLACSLPTVAMAKVSGIPCANCHTMHASQESGGEPATWDLTATPAAPRGALLATNCVGCHTADADDHRLTDVGGAPAVITNNGAQTDGIGILPGGFIDIGAAANTQHSVSGITGLLAETITAPPGYDGSRTDIDRPATWTDLSANPLTCAGTYGCHGDPSYSDQGSSVTGIHHNGTATGYRGLYLINGIESTEYDATKNGYSADDPGGANALKTISSLCAQCHGAFHDSAANEGDADGDTGDTSSTGYAWIRHPTDFALADAKQTYDDYDSYGGAGNAYNEEVPIGDSAIATVSTSSGSSAFDNWPAEAAGYVICLSCHRAHGSANADLLRWNYSTMEAGGTSATATGCFRCHTSKDDA